MSPRISSPAHPSGGGGERGRGRGGGAGVGRGGLSKRDREIIGQTVRIIQGPFKGEISFFILSKQVSNLEGFLRL